MDCNNCKIIEELHEIYQNKIEKLKEENLSLKEEIRSLNGELLSLNIGLDYF